MQRFAIAIQDRTDEQAMKTLFMQLRIPRTAGVAGNNLGRSNYFIWNDLPYPNEISYSDVLGTADLLDSSAEFIRCILNDMRGRSINTLSNGAAYQITPSNIYMKHDKVSWERVSTIHKLMS